jgi:hypothetical protein
LKDATKKEQVTQKQFENMKKYEEERKELFREVEMAREWLEEVLNQLKALNILRK